MDHAMALIAAFAAYARDRRIVISPVIKPHRFPGRGLGIAATSHVKVGLMQQGCNADGEITSAARQLLLRQAMQFGVEGSEQRLGRGALSPFRRLDERN